MAVAGARSAQSTNSTTRRCGPRAAGERELEGAAVRIYKRLHTEVDGSQSVSQSAHVMDVGKDCWCLGRRADGMLGAEKLCFAAVPGIVLLPVL